MTSHGKVLAIPFIAAFELLVLVACEELQERAPQPLAAGIWIADLRRATTLELYENGDLVVRELGYVRPVLG